MVIMDQQPLLPPADGMLPLNPSDLATTTSQQSHSSGIDNAPTTSHAVATYPVPQDPSAPTTCSAVAHVGEGPTMTATLPATTPEFALPSTTTISATQENEPQRSSVATTDTPIAQEITVTAPSAIQIPQPAAQEALAPAATHPLSTSRPTTPTKQVSSGASSPLSYLSSSPLSERSSFTDDDPEPSLNVDPVVNETFKRQHAPEPQVLIDCAFERDGPEGEGVLRLKPTADQWANFPAILHFAKHHGALNDGCFKVILPAELQDPVPEKPQQVVPCNAYRPKRLKNNFWRVDVSPAQGTYSSEESNTDFTQSTQAALQKLKKLFCKNIDRRIRDVRYRADVPAWTKEQRRRAGVPERSPVHPLKGDELDFSHAIIPGIHTPYVYESAAPFGATFQIHAEDFKLISLNHLYKGRKIWIVIPSTSIEDAEVAFGRKKCAQFMRHRAEFIFPDKLTQLKVPHRIVDQRPGETVVILPDAYHQGFSTGYTLAEAKNYADADWKIDEYEPCGIACKLPTAIPELFMRPVPEGQARLDLCARYDDAGNMLPIHMLVPVPAAPQEATSEAAQAPKRELDMEVGEAHGEEDAKRIRVA